MARAVASRSAAGRLGRQIRRWLEGRRRFSRQDSFDRFCRR